MATAVLSASLTLWASAAEATTCIELCGSGTGSCNLTGTINVTPGSVLDCTGRDVTVSGDVRVDDGAMTLKARDVTVSSGSQFRARQISSGNSSLTLDVSRDLTVTGRIDVSADERAGLALINVGRNLVVTDLSTGGIRARGEGSGSDGGDLAIQVGGNATIHGLVYADGNGSGESFGGQITLDVVGTVSVSSTGRLDAGAHLGQAGAVAVSSGSTLTVTGLVTAAATGQDGYGGEISLAGETVTINSNMTVVGGTGLASSLGLGGDVEVTAGCGGIAVNATIDATNSGSIQFESDGPITVGASGWLRSEATNTGGSGGEVKINGRSLTGTVTAATSSRIYANGNGAGSGGRVEIGGCGVQISSGSTIDARGTKGGSVQLVATNRGSGGSAQGGSLFVSAGALVKAAGASGSSKPGLTRLMLRGPQSGKCSNDENRSCTFDSGCVVGCSSGTCNGENPNTENVISQFDTAPITLSNAGLLECTTVCGGGL